MLGLEVLQIPAKYDVLCAGWIQDEWAKCATTTTKELELQLRNESLVPQLQCRAMSGLSVILDYVMIS